MKVLTKQIRVLAKAVEPTLVKDYLKVKVKANSLQPKSIFSNINATQKYGFEI